MRKLFRDPALWIRDSELRIRIQDAYTLDPEYWFKEYYGRICGKR
jgi:hypothetical protein